MAYRVAVAVSGRGSNMLALHRAVQGDPSIELVLVLSDREAAALDAARSVGIRTFRLPRHDDAAAWCAALADARAQLLVLAGYLRLVPQQVLDFMRGEVLNIHPALLPRHGGAGMYGGRVHSAVLAAGDHESGATIHRVNSVYDQGEIVAQLKVNVHPGDTAEALADRVLSAEHVLLPAAVKAAARAGRVVSFVP